MKDKTFIHNCVEFNIIESSDGSCKGCFFKNKNCVGLRTRKDIPECSSDHLRYIFKVGRK